jgi:hypothetical protein
VPDNRTDAQQLTPAAIRAAVAERIAAAPVRLLEELRNAALPPAADTLALAALALHLDGIRLRFVSWTPSPQMSPQEATGFFALVDEMVTTQIIRAVDDQIERRARTYGWTQARFNEWQRTREAWNDRPTAAALAAMKDADPEDDTFERVDLGDGKFAIRYRLREGRAERTGQ